ncbi:MAG: CBS domain-containing protein [Nitrososphaerota archaeon]|jgi:CBS domain-containing protein|nr:CBS domain-containing protein [Nitrososphaerota archaeon]MDG6938576.1 CBS domain-containing protein [Nitrososphaerota archaeon]MDG6956661.1 CBS domain-containing protein [Nitrososphaerota archaeon]MDG6969107.1 CBS domain-containing protein [Nitrososphaerota archaeon]MDG6972012.1 CBS domain-containing protein [Nitrososphaerota archaeon]
MSQKHAGPLAKDFMGTGVITVYQESKVEKAVRAMDEHDIGSVVVLDNLGPCGVFTERDLLSRVLARGKDPQATVISEVASPRFPSIESASTLEEVADAMVTKKSRLMVFDGAALVGIVTPTDLVRVIKDVGRDFSILKVISTNVVTATAETPVDAVVALMDQRKVGSVLLSEDGKWTGIFTERDLVRRVLARRRRLDTPLADVATRPLVMAEPGTLGREAAQLMAAHKFKRLPLSLDGEGVGVVTARDLVEAFANANRPRAPRVDWIQWT